MGGSHWPVNNSSSVKNPPIASLFLAPPPMIGHQWKLCLDLNQSLHAPTFQISPSTYQFSFWDSSLKNWTYLLFYHETHFMTRVELVLVLVLVITAGCDPKKNPMIRRQFSSLAAFLPRGWSRWSKFHPVVFEERKWNFRTELVQKWSTDCHRVGAHTALPMT